MRVAVVIAARDIALYLGDAIGSALSQTAGDVSVIVVDDGSADRTPDVIARLGSPRLYSLRTSGLGVSAARTTWVQATRSPSPPRHCCFWTVMTG